MVRALEERIVPNSYTVTNTSDAGAGSLRQAILDANANPGADTINFDAAVFNSAQTIVLTSPLPDISDSVTISGPPLANGRPRLTVSGRQFDIDGPGTLSVTISNLVVTGVADSGIRIRDEVVTLTNMVVTGNSTTGNGGGVYVSGAGRLIADGCSFDSNAAVSFLGSAHGGGGIALNLGANLTLTNCSVSGNTTRSNGGGNGGGIYAFGNNEVQITNCTISDNSAGDGMFQAQGGGIWARAPVLAITGSTISGNYAAAGGGGVTVTIGALPGDLTVRNSTISGNTAAVGGGVELYFFYGTLLVQNSTITGNVATTADTSAGYGGGGIAFPLGRGQPTAIILQSSIVAGNIATNGRADLAAPTDPNVTVAADHSLIGVADTGFALAPGSSGNQLGTLAAPLDPHLGPLADNGGPTKTHALLAGSPALNAGSNPAGLATDQRGLPRVVGPAADIGSYEYKPVGVQSVQVDDGSAQRSEVRSLMVTFSGAVAFANNDAAAAFTLTRIGGGAVGLAALVSANAAGQTVVTLTFTGGAATDPLSAQNGGQLSLADGRYQLVIADGTVTDAATGWGLDGDGNGLPGGTYVSPADTAGGGLGQIGLYRLFGDATGNGVVDLADLAALRAAFNAGIGNPAYLDYLDADHNGVVDLADLAQFRTRFNQTVF